VHKARRLSWTQAVFSTNSQCHFGALIHSLICV
jgi:hypothetical protein